MVNMSKKLTTAEFIDKAISKHGNRYDYSLTEYKSAQTKVKIICPDHGVFEQTASRHSNLGNGCPSCFGKFKITTQEFIERSKQQHGNKYDYSLVKYETISGKVKIICPDHGVFEQISESHMNGFGCAACTGNAQLTTEGFIEKAKKRHGDRYDYSMSKYLNSGSKVKVICKEHGMFEQQASAHSLGQGCPVCAGNNAKHTDNDAIYIWSVGDLKNKGIQVYKVGVTSARLDHQRINHVARKWNAQPTTIILASVKGKATDIELKLLSIGGEIEDLPKIDGNTEMRTFTSEQLVAALELINNSKGE